MLVSKELGYSSFSWPATKHAWNVQQALCYCEVSWRLHLATFWRGISPILFIHKFFDWISNSGLRSEDIQTQAITAERIWALLLIVIEPSIREVMQNESLCDSFAVATQYCKQRKKMFCKTKLWGQETFSARCLDVEVCMCWAWLLSAHLHISLATICIVKYHFYDLIVIRDAKVTFAHTIFLCRDSRMFACTFASLTIARKLVFCRTSLYYLWTFYVSGLYVIGLCTLYCRQVCCSANFFFFFLCVLVGIKAHYSHMG